MARRLLALASVGCALGCGGCALDIRPVPSARGAVTTTAAQRPSTVTDNEIPTPPGPDERAPTSASASTAVRNFAQTYVNWDAADVRAHLDALAASSVGQARGAMTLAAQQTAADPELTQAGIANHGRVEAVSALAGPGNRWVVVTLESTTASDSSAYQGLAPDWHLTLATVTRRGDGWVVNGWQPES